MKKGRGITINTDASFCPNKKVGGYAFYIKCDDFKITKSGIIREVHGSSDAELKAIGNAIHTLLHCKDLPSFAWIIVNTDSMVAMKWLKVKKDSGHKSTELVKNLIKRLERRIGGTKIEFRHVKAHSGKADARSWVNEWCDREAKIYMRSQRGSD